MQPDQAANTPLDQEINQALHVSWPLTPPDFEDFTEVSQGRGVFSRVYAVTLRWDTTTTDGPTPDTVVVKLPAVGPNRIAAIQTGAYTREADAYQRLLRESPIAVPTLYGVDRHDDGAVAFVLQDLRQGRFVDQVQGCGARDAVKVARMIGVWHRADRQASLTAIGRDFDLRVSTPRLLPEEGLQRGLETLRSSWSETLDPATIQRFESLVATKDPLIEEFSAAPPSVCHGDLRVDNLVFDHCESEVVLFDWQQIAIQPAEADLAWFTATSLEPRVRRAVERDLVQTFAEEANLDPEACWNRYRLGMILPGLAVLFLAQRELSTPRSAAFVATSLKRIGQAIEDHKLAPEYRPGC